MLEKKEKILLYVLGGILLICAIIYIFNKGNNEKEEYIEVSNEIIQTHQQEEETKKDIVIHVLGAVKNPGIVEVEELSRIIDVIEAAGGITEEADISKVNLAFIVEDGQKIFIPSVNEELIEETEYVTSESGDNVIISNKEEEIIRVNINKATQTELEILPGIGPSMALRIIEYREENGDFSEIEEIKNVKGIGEAKFENIKYNICVKQR